MRDLRPYINKYIYTCMCAFETDENLDGHSSSGAAIVQRSMRKRCPLFSRFGISDFLFVFLSPLFDFDFSFPRNVRQVHIPMDVYTVSGPIAEGRPFLDSINRHCHTGHVVKQTLDSVGKTSKLNFEFLNNCPYWDHQRSV